MLSAPTDKLYKFWAILGLGMLAFGIVTTVNAFDKRGIAYVLAMDKFDPAQRAAETYFGEMNELIEQVQIYNQNPNKESWENFDRYRNAHMDEIKRLQVAAMLADDANQRDVRAAEHAILMSKIWLAIGITCITVGSALSFMGFRNWIRKEA